MGVKLKKSAILVAILCFVILTGGCTSQTENKTAEKKAKLEIKSTAFEDGAMIPKKYTADGANVSPPLSWSSAPEGTKTFALICEDPDAPGGIFTHWIIFNIPSNTSKLPEGVPNQKALENGAKQGTNDFNKIGYSGPSPPSGTHRFYFKIYALDTELNLAAEVKREEFLKAMEGHILAEGQLMGKYGR